MIKHNTHYPLSLTLLSSINNLHNRCTHQGTAMSEVKNYPPMQNPFLTCSTDEECDTSSTWRWNHTVAAVKIYSEKVLLHEARETLSAKIARC